MRNVLVGWMLAGLLGVFSTPAGAAPLRVVATFSVIGDAVERVAGDRAQLTVLVGGNGDPHVFDPTASDARRLAAADILFEHGLGLEGWIDRLYRASGSKARRIVVSDDMRIRRVGTACCAGHASGLPVDPHTWHEVANMRRLVASVTEALARARPALEREFRDRAAAYDRELAALDQWVRAEVERVPIDRRKLVTAHESLGYFAEAYGFEVIGVVLPSLSTEAADPPPAELARLARLVREAGVSVIFADASHSTRLARAVAREAGVGRVAMLHTDGLGSDPGNRTYSEMMRSNVRTIVEALVPALAQQERLR